MIFENVTAKIMAMLAKITAAASVSPAVYLYNMNLAQEAILAEVKRSPSAREARCPLAAVTEGQASAYLDWLVQHDEFNRGFTFTFFPAKVLDAMRDEHSAPYLLAAWDTSSTRPSTWSFGK